MAIRNIIKKGDEVLSKKCKKVTEFDAKLHQILDDMKETMVEANGVGLAAPQIGLLRQIVVVLNMESDEIMEFINPEILEISGEETAVEGCLSLPGVYGYVSRPTFIKLTAFDRFGNKIDTEAEGFQARIFFHELDHLEGNLFDDKVTEFVDPSELSEEEDD